MLFSCPKKITELEEIKIEIERKKTNIDALGVCRLVAKRALGCTGVTQFKHLFAIFLPCPLKGHNKGMHFL